MEKKNRRAPVREHASAQAGDLFRFLERQREAMLGTLRELVELESPSHDKCAVDRLGERVGCEFERVGGRVKFHRASDVGNHLQADFAAAGSKSPILLLGHLDTVWEVGTLRTMPFAVRDGRAWGPGAFDMKSGI